MIDPVDQLKAAKQLHVDIIEQIDEDYRGGIVTLEVAGIAQANEIARFQKQATSIQTQAERN